MNDQTKITCLHCGRDEQQVPLVTWRYQGRNLFICADCLPALIHERAVIMAKLSAANTGRANSAGEISHAQR